MRKTKYTAMINQFINDKILCVISLVVSILTIFKQFNIAINISSVLNSSQLFGVVVFGLIVPGLLLIAEMGSYIDYKREQKVYNAALKSLRQMKKE